MDTQEELDEYRDRLLRAKAEIERMARAVAIKGENPTQHARLSGKADGLGLALDYLRSVSM